MASTWSQRSRPWHKRPKENRTVVSPPQPLGDLIRALKVDNLEDEAAGFKDTRISNVRTVTSYSWVDSSDSGPTILIPGKPPLWAPQPNLSPLKEDSGSYYRDKNAARYPKHPTEPAVVASLASDSSIPADVDIFACGSTLGNLLRFVRGQDRTFRMLAYKLRNTLFLVRRENSPTELIPDVRGYGHTFPEANTTWEADVKGSASHQRLIRYHFGGLDMVVRFEADGYIQPPNSPKQPRQLKSVTPKTDALSLDALTASLSTTTVSPRPAIPPDPSHAHLATAPAGTLVPQSALFDLKTRSIKTRLLKDHLAEELPRLWVSQIPTFILAFHTRGLFKAEDTEVRDVRGEVQQWETEHDRELAKLAALLHWVRDIIREEADGRIELCKISEEGKLEVRRVLGGVGEVLSEGVKEAWERVGAEGSSLGDGEERKQEGGGENVGVEWDADEEDFTACGDACGYCGRCTY